MKYLILSTLFCVAVNGQIDAQDISKVNVHLFTDKSEDVQFSFEYVVSAEESIMGIEETKFENTIRLSKVRSTNDTIVVEIEADSTRIERRRPGK